MELHIRYRTLLNSYGVNTPVRISHFMAQIEQESGLKPVSENLNYSAVGLLRVFPKYFNSETAKIYARNPEKIANRVYANRMGNGNEESGDGWRYRGRGFMQITGKHNYILLSKDTRIDYLSNPDMLLNEADAMISAVWYWNRINGNSLADKGDIRQITRRINGGYNGLSERINKLKKWKTKLGI